MFSKSLPGPHIVNWGDNYPAVIQNDLSDRTLPLVKVECVMKTTDRAPPLAVNNFYGTKHHCVPMMVFNMITPLKFNRQSQVTGPKASGVADYDYRADLYGWIG